MGSARNVDTEHVEVRLKRFPPTPSALPVSFLRRTRSPVPFLRVAGLPSLGPLSSALASERVVAGGFALLQEISGLKCSIESSWEGRRPSAWNNWVLKAREGWHGEC